MRKPLALFGSGTNVGRVAKATGFSASFTSEVLSAKKSNDRIVNKAYDMTRGRMRNSVKG